MNTNGGWILTEDMSMKEEKNMIGDMISICGFRSGGCFSLDKSIHFSERRHGKLKMLSVSFYCCGEKFRLVWTFWCNNYIMIK
jgi:hypothetical protein